MTTLNVLSSSPSLDIRTGQRVLLLQLDGKMPNLALMRLSAHCKSRGASVEFRRAFSRASVTRGLFDDFDHVFASAIFERTKLIIENLKRNYDHVIVGGTGSGDGVTLEALGVAGMQADYSIYPEYRHSIGFTQRGCRLSCKFCVVPTKEGKVREEQSIAEIWRGEPWPRNIVLLDNDFFGQPRWRDRIDEIRAGNFRVSFNQGINARMLTDETAAAIASVRYSDDDFTCRRIYTAWDSLKDEKRLFAGLEALARHGVKPDQIMVYMLIGYWPGETHEDREHRRARLREFGARPFPMAYVTDDTPQDLRDELKGFQRWIVRRGDLMCSWPEFKAAGYRPEKVGIRDAA